MNRRRIALTVIIAPLVVVFVIASFLHAISHAHPGQRRLRCINNLKNIALALLHYSDANGKFPPAYTVDEEGNRLHSWRTLILPYMEQQALFDSIDLTKPWDDPANAGAREAVVELYQCPSADLEEGMTTYLGVVGPDCFFSGSTSREHREITDRWTTVMLIDAAPEHAVHWMSPEDISDDVLMGYGPETRTNHPRMFQVAYVDGHAGTISLDTDRDTLRALLTIAGGEELKRNSQSGEYLLLSPE